MYISFLLKCKISLSCNLPFYSIFLQRAVYFIESVVLNQKVILVMYTLSALMYFSLIYIYVVSESYYIPYGYLFIFMDNYIIISTINNDRKHITTRIKCNPILDILFKFITPADTFALMYGTFQI